MLYRENRARWAAGVAGWALAHAFNAALTSNFGWPFWVQAICFLALATLAVANWLSE